VHGDRPETSGVVNVLQIKLAESTCDDRQQRGNDHE